MSASPFREMSELSIVDETCVDNGDLCFTKAELDQMSTKLLRRLAANANTDEVSGRSTRLELTSYFRGQTSLDEYSEQ